MRWLEPVAREEAHADVDGQHEHEQHERARPGLPVPVVVGRNGVDENLQRHGGNGFSQFVRPAQVAERGEQQRRGFARHPRQRQQHAGDDAFEGGAHDDLHNGPPFGDAQRERGLTVAAGHQLQNLFRRPHHERNHHHAEHHAARQRGKAVHRHHQQRPNDHAPGDGRHAVQNVGGETNPPIQPRRAVFRKEHAAEHADRHTEQRGLPQQNERADNGVGHAAAGLADRLGQLGEERQVDGTETEFDEVIKDQQQRRDDQNRARERQRLHDGVLEIAPTMVGGDHRIND